MRDKPARADELHLSQIWPIPNAEDFKLHLACECEGVEPLDLFVHEPKTWLDWNQYKSRNEFSREFILALIEFYPEEHRWLFGGAWQIRSRHRGKDWWEYDLKPLKEAEPFIGRLKVILKRPGRPKAFYFEDHYSALVVSEILPTRYDGEAFPGYDAINLRFAELESIFSVPRLDWKAALEYSKGVYLITDIRNGQKYVGAAYGDAGLWSRWACYVRTGHGYADDLTRIINKHSLEYARKNFRFALLEYFPMRTEDRAVTGRETYWKDVLMTRQYGYNKTQSLLCKKLASRATGLFCAKPPRGEGGLSAVRRRGGSGSKSRRPSPAVPSPWGEGRGEGKLEARNAAGAQKQICARLALWLAVWLAMVPAAQAQVRPYIGFAYPAGGQQGATFQIRLGGQALDGVNAVLVTGSGVTARVAEYHRRLNNQEMQLLNEQLRDLRRETMSDSTTAPPMTADNPTMMPATTNENTSAVLTKEAARELIEKIERRTFEFVQTPACASLASVVIVEVTIARDAQPGEREIRLVTLRGVSNPLAFHVGQVPELSRKPMLTASLQVLGKEAQALRKRLPSEAEDRIAVPCTVNGQIASGEVNRYRFQARQGQRLVITTLGRQLVPFIADAVPGWFQPVLVLYDANGKEVAYDDDYRFNPDPTIFYEVPKDGEYVFVIHDSLYRGREDFVYRITIGELPFITSLFPLGGRAGAPAKPRMEGWNLQDAQLTPLDADAGPGIHCLAASSKGLISNRVPFALDNLPEGFDQEPNDTPASAQKVTLPIIINGRIDRPGDWDVFQFAGKSNDTLVAEVQARRLDSPLDSVIKLTDAAGNLLAFNDDYEDLGAGLNTHHADSYFMARLPADGPYYVHLGDTAQQGGQEYGYRLRLSAPQPDFDLRVVPSSLSLRAKSTAALTIYAMRKDGFAGPIKLGLKEPPAGFSATPVTLSGTQTVARLTLRTSLAATQDPVTLSICGSARIGGQEIARQAVPAEDRMQAFLWRHLVPAKDLKVLVFDPAYQPPPKRLAPLRPPSLAATNAPVSTNAIAGTNAVSGTNAAAAKPKFTKQQIAGRLKELKLLFEEGMLTDEFYNEKVAESETAQ
jgi:hypothetical protein